MVSFFSYKMSSKRAQKGVYRNERFFLLRDFIEVRQVAVFYTTIGFDCLVTSDSMVSMASFLMKVRKLGFVLMMLC